MKNGVRRSRPSEQWREHPQIAGGDVARILRRERAFFRAIKIRIRPCSKPYDSQRKIARRGAKSAAMWGFSPVPARTPHSVVLDCTEGLTQLKAWGISALAQRLP